MKARKWMWIGLMSMGAMPNWASAQVPATPAAFPGAAPPGVLGPAIPVQQPATLWGYLGVSKPQLKACRYEKCATPCGQLFNKMTLPMSAMTGGIIPGFCPIMPSPAELADQGAVGDAAKIKALEAQAKARKAAMRYLGTVDCIRFPEAMGSLIGGLRGDTNECVRYEAALALGNGCCCNKKTMEALSISASCSDRDKLPREYSDRVRAAAAAALERCLACYVDPNPPKENLERPPANERPPQAKPEQLKVPSDAQSTMKNSDDKDVAKAESKEKAQRPVGMEYYAKIDEVPMHLIVEEARRVVDKYNETASAAAVLRRETSVVGMINQAMGDTQIVSPTVMENGIPMANAQVVSARPQNLWDMVSRKAEPAGFGNQGRTEVVMGSTIEPPTAIAKYSIPMPMPTKMDPAPIFPEPTMVKSAKPKENKGYGESTEIRPKTPAELAALPRIPTGGVSQAKTSTPNPLPSAVMAKDAFKLTERESLKPVETANPTIAKQIEPSTSTPISAKPVEPVGPAPTALAQRALTVLTESHPAQVREQIAGSLTKADFESCPEMAPVLVELARGNEVDSTRKAAIQALVRNQINSPAIVLALEKLADNAPPTVRVEAAIGLARLKVGK